MTRLMTITAVAAMAVASPGGTGGTGDDGAPPAARKDPAAPNDIALKLEQIKEVRRTDLVSEDPDSGFSMFDKAGLELRFAIQVPPGRNIVEVQQPVTLDAFDSVGTDLTAIVPSTFGRREYVETMSEWDHSPHALTFKLALPARTAEHFSLTARMNALTYRHVVTGTVALDADWMPVTGDIFAGKEVKVRLERKRANVQVVFAPGSVRDMIESVQLEQSGVRLESEGTMWNDLQVAYMFTIDPSASTDAAAQYVARLRVRKGLETMPMRIEIREHPLP